MRVIEIPQNDVGAEIGFTVLERDGSIKNLTGYTPHFIIWTLGTPGTLLLDGTCVIVVAASGTCKYTTVLGDINMDPDRYQGEIELTNVGGDRLSTLPFTVRITESPTS